MTVPNSPPDDDAPEICYRCGGPLPASVGDWWLSADGVYCSRQCADGTRPEDVPDGADPVCDACKLPAEYADGAWRHVEAADEVFCSILKGVFR